MTLLGKFLNIKCYSTRPVDLSTSQAIKCVKVAEDFAIDFTEWMTINYPNQRKLLLKQGNLMGFYSTKRLLEIHKKEKGL